jgi:hypothetical protein
VSIGTAAVILPARRFPVPSSYRNFLSAKVLSGVQGQRKLPAGRLMDAILSSKTSASFQEPKHGFCRSMVLDVSALIEVAIVANGRKRISRDFQRRNGIRFTFYCLLCVWRDGWCIVFCSLQRSILFVNQAERGRSVKSSHPVKTGSAWFVFLVVTVRDIFATVSRGLIHFQFQRKSTGGDVIKSLGMNHCVNRARSFISRAV